MTTAGMTKETMERLLTIGRTPNQAEELATLKAQLAECQTELEAVRKDAERMLDALTFIKNEVSLTSSQYEVIRQAMREGE